MTNNVAPMIIQSFIHTLKDCSYGDSIQEKKDVVTNAKAIFPIFPILLRRKNKA